MGVGEGGMKAGRVCAKWMECGPVGKLAQSKGNLGQIQTSIPGQVSLTLVTQFSIRNFASANPSSPLGEAAM